MPRNFSVSNVLFPLKWHACKTNFEVKFLFPFRFLKNRKHFHVFQKQPRPLMRLTRYQKIETTIIVTQYYLPMLLTFRYPISGSGQPQKPFNFFLGRLPQLDAAVHIFRKAFKTFLLRQKYPLCAFLNKAEWTAIFHSRKIDRSRPKISDLYCRRVLTMVLKIKGQIRFAP